MTRNRLIKQEAESDFDWQCAIKDKKSYRGEVYAAMFSVTGKDRRLVLHVGDSLVNRMKWRKGDRIMILICRKTMKIALRRAVDGEPGMVLTGKNTERLRCQFHNDTRTEVGISSRVILKDEDFVFDRDLAITSMWWFVQDKEKAQQ